jgi:hypothetical protein
MKTNYGTPSSKTIRTECLTYVFTIQNLTPVCDIRIENRRATHIYLSLLNLMPHVILHFPNSYFGK